MTPFSDSNHQSVTLAVAGMSCGHCVAGVRKALESVPGVSEPAVAIGSATFTVDGADRERVLADAVRAIADAGYTATP